MIESVKLEQIKNILSKINDELDVLAKYMQENGIDYKPALFNLEMKMNDKDKYYKELRLQLEIIERID